MVEYMEGWKKRLPHFIEVKSDQPSNVAQHGWPVDVLPVQNTALGKALYGSDIQVMQPYLNCCAENIWFPLHKAILDCGATKAIKGQRRADDHKSPSKDGDTVYGITMLMPIYDWSTQQVFSYLKEVGAELAPGYLQGEKTGRDCWDCTAYLSDNRKRIENLPGDKKLEIKRRLGIIDQAIRTQWGPSRG
jgi:3'-phosphoadenosine 5'-phosphosulfate sulfotransferase (PAPS reductase)/FAD synthetase